MARKAESSRASETRRTYPLHVAVWNNEYDLLKASLIQGVTSDELEKKDVRGRSPLMLAVTLGHLEVSKLLMEFGANVNTENKDGWTVVQEAVATGDPELLHSVLEWRDYQRYSSRVGGVPDLLLKLKEAPDFYVEMKWEFTSWVPLVSRMCPSDTYKVYKQGSKVRIDTTLLGFEQNKWHRGNTSFIFHGQDDQATIMEVDHENEQVFVEQMRMIGPTDLQVLQPSPQSVKTRLTAPITTTYLDTDKISFERNKSGIWGWRQDKTEVINSHQCKVFGASNVQLVTKTRTEHLSEEEKAKFRSSSKSPLQSFLGIAETEERSPTPLEEYTQFGNPCHISLEEYFDGSVDLGNRDIGRPKDLCTKIQKFKATLWLSEDYPLSLPEQIMPIVDLMAISSSHFAKLKNFIQMQLPSGFPVKIEIPLFHVLNARITFGNIFGLDSSVSGISTELEAGKTICLVDDCCFEAPSSYTKLEQESVGSIISKEWQELLGKNRLDFIHFYKPNLFDTAIFLKLASHLFVLGAESRRLVSLEEEDDMLQYAIQQSLLQSGHDEDQVDIWEALQVQRPTTPNCFDDEEKQLQRAIQASLTGDSTPGDDIADDEPIVDLDLIKAIKLSEKQREEEEKQRKMEQDMFEEVLKLSLIDK